MKKGLKILTFSLLLTIQSVFSLFAQDQIVLKKGDTMNVYVLKEAKYTNKNKLTYKISAESAESFVLSPSEVSYFRAGNAYVALQAITEMETSVLFLQKIIKEGEISLYKAFTEDNQVEYYVEQNKIVRFVSPLHLQKFVDELTNACSFDKTKYGEVSSKNYQQDFMMDLISAHNHCKDANIAYVSYYRVAKSKKKNAKKDEFHFGIKAGAGMQQYAFRSFGTGANNGLYGSAEFNFQPSFLGGVFAEIRYGSNFSMIIEASYLYRNAKSTDNILEFSYSGINIPLVFEFSFLRSKNKGFYPFLNFGANSLVAISEAYTFNPPSGTQLLKPLSISPATFGFLGGLGSYIAIKNKSIKVEFRFTQDYFEANNVTFGDDKLRISNAMFLLSYPIL